MIEINGKKFVLKMVESDRDLEDECSQCELLCHEEKEEWSPCVGAHYDGCRGCDGAECDDDCFWYTHTFVYKEIK